MRALRKLRRGAGQIELVDIPPPAPDCGEVLVQVMRAGVCGTDIHIFHDAYKNLEPPVTLGHEFSGIVLRTGPGVTKWKEGDRVVVESLASSCGSCRHCLAGDTQCCRFRKAYGISKDGGFAELVTAREESLHRLPSGVSFEEAAMIEPLCVAVHAVLEKSNVQAGDTVLITGPGTIGQLVSQVARLVGASVIMVGTSKDQARLNVATATGAEHCLSSDREDTSARIARITGGSGPDLAFECAGVHAAIQLCLSAVRTGGQVVQLGIAGRAIEIEYDLICLKEVEIRGSFTHNKRTWERAVALLSDPRLNLNALVSGVYPLEDWGLAFEKTAKAEGLKYLLAPNVP